MTRRVAVLRPEPGNAATCARLADAGIDPLALPLFEMGALPWQAPDPTDFDALLLTSANAARLAGPGLMAFAPLPLLTVGEATAAAARDAGLAPHRIGTHDAEALIGEARAMGLARLLHLGARETTIRAGGIVARSIAVYGSIDRALPEEALAALAGAVALVHSARAAARLAAIVDEGNPARQSIAIVAISDAAARAAGTRWQKTMVASAPHDGAMIDATRRLLLGD